jgi:hypothetical protein
MPFQRRFALRQLRDFGFGTNNMESTITEEIEKLIAVYEKRVGQPVILDSKISVVNALWQILVGQKLELDDPRDEGINTKFHLKITVIFYKQVFHKSLPVFDRF